MGETDDFVRLHITPLDQELLKVVIPASVLPVARNISYHTLETFPEKRYGFVELPEADAEKLKRKLNGSTLKGTKMRIEKARLETRIEATGEEDKPTKKRKSYKENEDGQKKRKREVDVLEGVALKNRNVKRGWTEAPTISRKRSKKDKDEKNKDEGTRKRIKSKYSDGEECLLKTKLPANVMMNLPKEDLERKRKSKKKGSSRQVTIHEFEKTTKFPSFLKQSSATDRKMATEFVEGKGWVDEEGNVVEEVKENKRPKKITKSKPVIEAEEEEEEEEEDDDDDTSSSGTSSSDPSSEDESDEEASLTITKDEPPKRAEKSASGSGNGHISDESDGGDAHEEKEEPSKAPEQATPTSAKAKGHKPTPPGPKPLAIIIPPPETPSSTKVHPLEALYKRPNAGDTTTSTPAPKDEPFSFFGGADAEADEPTDADAGKAVPMTPFTRQDFEWRNLRSAAPTPDTAHPTRMQRFWTGSPEKDVDLSMEDDDVAPLEEEENEVEDSTEHPTPGSQEAGTDFQKWFWENRRDLNRSWMTRRKTVAKEKRHRENKAKASKAV